MHSTFSRLNNVVLWMLVILALLVAIPTISMFSHPGDTLYPIKQAVLRNQPTTYQLEQLIDSHTHLTAGSSCVQLLLVEQALINQLTMESTDIFTSKIRSNYQQSECEIYNRLSYLLDWIDYQQLATDESRHSYLPLLTEMRAEQQKLIDTHQNYKYTSQQQLDNISSGLILLSDELDYLETELYTGELESMAQKFTSSDYLLIMMDLKLNSDTEVETESTTAWIPHLAGYCVANPDADGCGTVELTTAYNTVVSQTTIAKQLRAGSELFESLVYPELVTD